MSDEVVFYAMEAEHLERLKNAAKRLYTERSMDGNEMRDFAHSIMTVVRYAESLSALHGVKELHVHLYPERSQPSAAYYEITPDDVHRVLIKAFGREWAVSDFKGRITDQDIGKRVYLRDGALQIENNQQLKARLANGTAR